MHTALDDVHAAAKPLRSLQTAETIASCPQQTPSCWLHAQRAALHSAVPLEAASATQLPQLQSPKDSDAGTRRCGGHRRRQRARAAARFCERPNCLVRQRVLLVAATCFKVCATDAAGASTQACCMSGEVACHQEGLPGVGRDVCGSAISTAVSAGITSACAVLQVESAAAPHKSAGPAPAAAT
jgi:hypothetical protein